VAVAVAVAVALSVASGAAGSAARGPVAKATRAQIIVTGLQDTTAIAFGDGQVFAAEVPYGPGHAGGASSSGTAPPPA